MSSNRCSKCNHELVNFGNIKWCKFCGTLYIKYIGDEDEMLAYYPESLIYLPKEESKDETKV